MMTSIDQAVTAPKQHKKPCHDCPWRRESIKGWLGGAYVSEWIAEAHGEGSIPCHTISNQQCAGSAIYRANVCKSVRDSRVLYLPSDREIVFASPKEFTEHHKGADRCATEKRGS